MNTNSFNTKAWSYTPATTTWERCLARGTGMTFQQGKHGAPVCGCGSNKKGRQAQFKGKLKLLYSWDTATVKADLWTGKGTDTYVYACPKVSNMYHTSMKKTYETLYPLHEPEPQPEISQPEPDTFCQPCPSNEDVSSIVAQLVANLK